MRIILLIIIPLYYIKITQKTRPLKLNYICTNSQKFVQIRNKKSPKKQGSKNPHLILRVKIIRVKIRNSDFVIITQPLRFSQDCAAYLRHTPFSLLHNKQIADRE